MNCSHICGTLEKPRWRSPLCVMKVKRKIWACGICCNSDPNSVVYQHTPEIQTVVPVCYGVLADHLHLLVFLSVGGIAVISFVPCFLYVYKPICESHSIFVSTSLVYCVLPPKYFSIVVVPINRIHYLIKAWSFLSVDYNQIQQLCHSIWIANTVIIILTKPWRTWLSMFTFSTLLLWYLSLLGYRSFAVLLWCQRLPHSIYWITRSCSPVCFFRVGLTNN